MIKIDRIELREIGMCYICSNTPYALYDKLKVFDFVIRLKNECSFQYLSNYYDYLTSRVERNEISVGLAYGVLIAILTKPKSDIEPEGKKIDLTRLRWGNQIEEYVRKSFPADQSLIIPFQNAPKIEFFSDSGSDLIKSIYEGVK